MSDGCVCTECGIFAFIEMGHFDDYLEANPDVDDPEEAVCNDCFDPSEHSA
jgi:hypothetical protein